MQGRSAVKIYTVSCLQKYALQMNGSLPSYCCTHISNVHLLALFRFWTENVLRKSGRNDAFVNHFIHVPGCLSFEFSPTRFTDVALILVWRCWRCCDDFVVLTPSDDASSWSTGIGASQRTRSAESLRSASPTNESRCAAFVNSNEWFVVLSARCRH